METINTKEEMKTISFYSYKGGVGRTMLTAQFARILSALGQKVAVADFDFDAPGIPVQFGKNMEDIECGLLELAGEFFVRDDDDEFRKKLEDDLENKWLQNVGFSLKGNDIKNPGSISILPCGKIDRDYWESISKVEIDLKLDNEQDDQIEKDIAEAENMIDPNERSEDFIWLKFLNPREKENEMSLAYFIEKFFKPVLKKKGFDYFLIDARAGITPYGDVARHVADYQIMVFAPTLEIQYALGDFLLEDLNKFYSKRKTLEKIAFVVSRMPPEQIKTNENKDKEAIFADMVKLIKGNDNDKKKLSDELQAISHIFRLHADLELQIHPTIRNIEEHYKIKPKKGDPDDPKKDIVQIHEDIFTIFSYMFPKLVSNGINNKDFKEQGHIVWNTIFPKNEFQITYKNRLFNFMEETGAMVNPGDGQRNVAFKVATFIGLLNNVYTTLYPVLAERGTELFEEAIFTAGLHCGDKFGKDIAPKWKEYNTSDKISHWCQFDADTGFGLLEYDEKDKILKVENPFILDVASGAQDNLKFFTGYVTGVLRVLTGTDKLELPDPDRITRQGTTIIEYRIEEI